MAMSRPAIRFKAGRDVELAILDGTLALKCRMGSMLIVVISELRQLRFEVDNCPKQNPGLDERLLEIVRSIRGF